MPNHVSPLRHEELSTEFATSARFQFDVKRQKTSKGTLWLIDKLNSLKDSC